MGQPGAEIENQPEAYVETVTPAGASGWAWLPERPNERLCVEARRGGVVIAKTVANVPREDLLATGRGSGQYGFYLSFVPPLEGDEQPTIVVTNGQAAHPLPAPRLNLIEGFVEELTPNQISGWAWLPMAPTSSVEISATIDNEVVGRSSANLYRHDIAKSGRGTGKCGFLLQFRPPLAKIERIQINATGSGAAIELPRLQHTAAPLSTPAMSPDVSSRARNSPDQIEGHVDYACANFATGWAWNAASPHESVVVEARLEGVIIAQTRARDSREDLKQWGRGSGKYGFHITFDPPLVTRPILHAVASSGSRAQLSGTFDFSAGASPISKLEAPSQAGSTDDSRIDSDSLAPAGAPPRTQNIEGHVDNLSRWGASGWAWNSARPDEGLRIIAVLEGEVIGEAVANELRDDLVQYNKGTGRYGFHIDFSQPIKGEICPEIRVLVSEVRLGGEYSLPPVTTRELAARPRGGIDDFVQAHASFTAPGPMFEEQETAILTSPIGQCDRRSDPLMIAYYLPQFHAISENDKFWGTGFTEWRQLPRGIGRFPGHYQPRLPRDLGFYNLLDQDVLRRQSLMAKAAGIGAFAYYYYWFNGRRVLEKPLNALLDSDIDMPFLLVWANENWTRTWDGSEAEVLLRQDYMEDDETPLLADLARHMRDSRYVRLQDRPLLILYNPKPIPDATQTIGRWRLRLRTEFGLEPLVFMAQTFGETDPRAYGLDGAIEFPPHKLSNTLPGRKTPDAYSPIFSGRVIAYDDFVRVSLAEEAQPYPLIKTVVPSWDNDCRRPNRGLTLEGSTPAKYQAWLTALLERAYDSPIFGRGIVAVNAWNEWAEGAYLEPDIHFGSAYLNATARAFRAAQSSRELTGGQRKVTAILPNFNHAKFLPERISSVVSQSLPPDEIIFLDDASSDESISVARRMLKKSGIRHKIVANKKNSGCVFKQWVKGLSLASNDLIWIAETDDSADRDFLKRLLPAFNREDVMAAFGWIKCVDEEGKPRTDLDPYFDDLTDFSWTQSTVVPAYRAFRGDFVRKNVIPNASGLVFKRPKLSSEELDRLFSYKFAGDWYFYALMLRGGALAYCSNATSYFRIRTSSTSRSAFSTERHLLEHRQVLEDISYLYGVTDDGVAAHARGLAHHFPHVPLPQLERQLIPAARTDRPLRVLVAAHSFGVGGGEVLPVELSNGLKALGAHVTYMTMEDLASGAPGIRHRLHHDIPVVAWKHVKNRFTDFLDEYGIDLINSHNVSVEFQLALSQAEIRIPYVSSLHGGYETVPEILTPEFVGFVKKTVSSWLYLSEKNIRALLAHRIDAQKTVHSFNAVPAVSDPVNRKEFRAGLGVADQDFLMVICSRAIAEKGWGRATEIAKRLNVGRKRFQLPPVHLVLIGDGPELETLKQKCSNLAYIHFLGHVDSPARYFSSCDLAVFPSQYTGETFPLFLLECFQAGIPVVSTDIGEIPRMMGSPAKMPGKTVSHTASSADIVRQMTSMIREICADRGLYRRMSKNALAAAEKFGMDRLLAFYLSNFSDLVRDRDLVRDQMAAANSPVEALRA